MEQLEYNTKLLVCDTTIGNIFKQLMVENPTVLDNIKCTTTTCDKTINCPIPVPYITLHITNGNLNSLEDKIKQRLLTENTTCHNVDKNGKTCKGIKTIQPISSSMHLLIELLNWEGI